MNDIDSLKTQLAVMRLIRTEAVIMFQVIEDIFRKDSMAQYEKLEDARRAASSEGLAGLCKDLIYIAIVGSFAYCVIRSIASIF